MPEIDIAANMQRDGLLVDGSLVLIRQRMGKGDIMVRASDITEIRPSRSMGDVAFLQGSLNLRVGGKKYVLRRLPKKDRDNAVKALQQAAAR